MAKKDIIISANALADYYDCTAQYVGKILKELNIPKVGKGYNLETAVRLYIRHLKENKKADTDAETEAKIRQMEAKAQLLELQLHKEQEQLLTIDDAIGVLGDGFTAIRSTLMSLPNRIAPQVVHLQTAGEVEGLVKKIVAEALDELANISVSMKQIKIKATDVDDADISN